MPVPSLPHRRRSIRLRDYDYRQDGAYFITICAYQRACVFGEIINGTMQVNESGKIVVQEWEQTAIARPYVELDAFVVMPNHVHGIMVMATRLIDSSVGAQRAAPLQATTDGVTSNNVASGSLGAIVRAFKSAVTKRINQRHNTPGEPVWQRNYYEHIVRSESELNTLRRYIEFNPLRWNEDTLHPMKRSSW